MERFKNKLSSIKSNYTRKLGKFNKNVFETKTKQQTGKLKGMVFRFKEKKLSEQNNEKQEGQK